MQKNKSVFRGTKLVNSEKLLQKLPFDKKSSNKRIKLQINRPQTGYNSKQIERLKAQHKKRMQKNM